MVGFGFETIDKLQRKLATLGLQLLLDLILDKDNHGRYVISLPLYVYAQHDHRNCCLPSSASLLHTKWLLHQHSLLNQICSLHEEFLEEPLVLSSYSANF